MTPATFLFDLDDTLLDFGTAEETAFNATLGPYAHDSKVLGQWLATYQGINANLWRGFEEGKVTISQIKNDRFHLLREGLRLGVNAGELSTTYLKNLSQHVHLLPHALETCRVLSARHHPLAIVTNGFAEVQHPRLEISGLGALMSAVVISEECGFTKPDRRIFDIALERTQATDPAHVWIIGDRLETDIAGGIRAGIKTCWYNPTRKPNLTNLKPDREITSLAELIQNP